VNPQYVCNIDTDLFLAIVQLTAKKNPFTLLTLDPSSSRAARLVLQGRTLDVTRAVSRDRAETLRETGERARERKDKRNLYLMREGGTSCHSPILQS
jgi:nucleolar protein 4